jgi:hypothetical protein
MRIEIIRSGMIGGTVVELAGDAALFASRHPVPNAT